MERKEHILLMKSTIKQMLINENTFGDIRRRRFLQLQLMMTCWNQKPRVLQLLHEAAVLGTIGDHHQLRMLLLYNICQSAPTQCSDMLRHAAIVVSRQGKDMVEADKPIGEI